MATSLSLLVCVCVVCICICQSSFEEVIYAELTLPQNGSVGNITWGQDPTIYAQIDHAKRNSISSPTTVNPTTSSTVQPPPSGYVRLPPVDQFHLIPYADNSSPSPSPSQYSGLTQQARSIHMFIHRILIM